MLDILNNATARRRQQFDVFLPRHLYIRIIGRRIPRYKLAKYQRRIVQSRSHAHRERGKLGRAYSFFYPIDYADGRAVLSRGASCLELGRDGSQCAS